MKDFIPIEIYFILDTETSYSCANKHNFIIIREHVLLCFYIKKIQK